MEAQQITRVIEIESQPSKLRVEGSSPSAPTRSPAESAGGLQLPLDPEAREPQPNAFSGQPQASKPATTIGLTKGYRAIIDLEDLARVSRFKWHANLKDGGVYAERTAPKGENRYLHHFVMDRKPDEWYDHKSGDSLDCRKDNLRRCNQEGNNRNRRKSSRSTSPYKGVEKRGARWSASIYVGDKRRRLGSFDTPEEAARRYNEVSAELFPEFSRPNPIHPSAGGAA